MNLIDPEEPNTPTNEQQEFVNPIDKDKIAENPGLLPYAHTVGGVVIKPTEQGVIKGQAMQAMSEQTDMQMKQIYDQMRLLADQAKKIQDRVEISKVVYEALINFEPRIGKIYHLYKRFNGEYLLSLIAPEEWGKKMPFEEHCATVRLLADHTWEVVEETSKP